jgi:hypothetical protein
MRRAGGLVTSSLCGLRGHIGVAIETRWEDNDGPTEGRGAERPPRSGHLSPGAVGQHLLGYQRARDFKAWEVWSECGFA